MADARSPNYPAMSLEQAVKNAEELWKREHRTTVAPEVAVKAFGYKGTSGPARVALGSLKQYGLLQKVGTGVRLSDLAIRLLNPSDSTDRSRAIQEAALTPRLFKDLHENYGRASDDAIASYLVTQLKFVPRGVQHVIRAFRNSMAFAGLLGTGPAQASDESTTHVPQIFPSVIHTSIQPEGSPSVRGGVLLLRVPFQDGEITVRLEASGTLTQKHIARVRRYLALAEEDLAEQGDDSTSSELATSGDEES